MTTNGTSSNAATNRYGVPSAPGVDSSSDAIISVRHLRKWFPVGNSFFSRNKSILKAVDDVSFDIERGKTMGLVGESGCGKTTTLKVMLGLEELPKAKYSSKARMWRLSAARAGANFAAQCRRCSRTPGLPSTLVCASAALSASRSKSTPR